MWRRCRPLPPLRRPTFFLEKVGKTARSCIRPYASLRVPSLRHLPGPRGLRLASPSLRLAFFGYAEGAAHRPLQVPTLGLLKSQSAAPELTRMKIKNESESESLLTLLAGLSRDGLRLVAPESDFEDTPVQAPPVTLRLQEAEWRCLEGAGAQHPSALAEVREP